MRPTIPISQWKIAVDLEQTRKIQLHLKMQGNGCECKFCQNWRLVFNDIFPKYLSHQLTRLGICLQHPVNAYGNEPNDGQINNYRIWYYVVGKILSGPSTWLQREKFGDIRNYITLNESPDFLSLAIQYQDQFFDLAPELTAF